MRSWNKTLDSLARAENISVINIVLVLNPKHSSYWEENKLYPSEDQDTYFGSRSATENPACTNLLVLELKPKL